MRRILAAAAAVTLLSAGAASAQEGPFRRFTRDQRDTNRSERMVYVPLATSSTDSRPGEGRHSVSAATWYLLPVGAESARPDIVLDDATYTVESFRAVPGSDGPRLRVSILRSPGPAPGAGLPELRVVNPSSNITSRALPRVTQVSGGARYVYEMDPPHKGFMPRGDRMDAERYELRFMPASGVEPPAALARRPTFAGEDIAVRSSNRPRLTPAERVAGRRIEYRAAGPVVTVDDRVAGRREELRRRR